MVNTVPCIKKHNVHFAELQNISYHHIKEKTIFSPYEEGLKNHASSHLQQVRAFLLRKFYANTIYHNMCIDILFLKMQPAENAGKTHNLAS